MIQTFHGSMDAINQHITELRDRYGEDVRVINLSSTEDSFDLFYELIGEKNEIVEELKEQIDYIEEWVGKCKKECKPSEDRRDRGELLGYNTVESIIKNSKNKERREYDKKLKKEK